MIELHNIDCMEYLATLEDNSFELAIVDPPYGIGADKQSRKPETVKQRNGKFLRVKNSNSYTQKQWDAEIPDKVYFEELKRVSKNQIIWGANYFGLIGGYIVWDKMNGESDQYGCELAYNSINKRTDIIRFLWQGMFQGIHVTKCSKKASIQQGNKKLNEKRIHPTQKPVKLYEWLLMNYAKEGDRILDTHLGSGSIAIACHNLGFDLVSCELDTDYFNAAQKRLKQHQSQMRIPL
jgi:site-specific DNA-methyltransferase (adenine-specific)